MSNVYYHVLKIPWVVITSLNTHSRMLFSCCFFTDKLYEKKLFSLKRRESQIEIWENIVTSFKYIILGWKNKLGCRGEAFCGFKVNLTLISRRKRDRVANEGSYFVSLLDSNLIVRGRHVDGGLVGLVWK